MDEKGEITLMDGRIRGCNKGKSVLKIDCE